MLRKFAGAAIVLLLVGSIALADTVRGLITAIGKGEVSITVREGKKGERKTEKKTFTYDKKTLKVFKVKGKDDKDKSSVADLQEAIEKSKGKTKGVFASVEVTDKAATEISYFTGRRKGKGKDKDKDKD
jgi:hypothetical protein